MCIEQQKVIFRLREESFVSLDQELQSNLKIVVDVDRWLLDLINVKIVEI